MRAALALTAVSIGPFTTGCHKELPPLSAQWSGTIELPGLSAPVRVVRDRWGVPHVYAQTRDDLFAAQGLIQAEDRLFQMDLWRRAALGRLAEVLGSNFIERDAMTRRVQYRGDPDEDWASYGPETKAIATAFTRGINAWVIRAREHPPEEFVLAGWKPEFWSPVDLLNRTDAFLEGIDAIDQLRRGELNEVVADALRRIGTPPFFVALAAPVRQPRRPDSRSADQTAAPPEAADRAPGSQASQGRVLASRDRLELSDAQRRFDHPSRRYLVHLSAPGWNVIGATAPWLPGVAVGHNERVAWGMTPIDASTADVRARPVDQSTTTVINEEIKVKGRSSPFVFDCALTPSGVVVASDRDHGRVFSLRWSGTEPGAAAGLAALALDRARTWREFREGLAKWKMPARRVVYADVDGTLGAQDAALVPRRQGGRWAGWLTLDDLPHLVNPRSGSITAEGPSRSGHRETRVVFSHALAVTSAARRRFMIGPLDRPAADDSPVRALFDLRDWDRSMALNAPGQSEAADSPRFADSAARWSRGEMAPLVFSPAAVEANAETTLVVRPPQRTR